MNQSWQVDKLRLVGSPDAEEGYVWAQNMPSRAVELGGGFRKGKGKMKYWAFAHVPAGPNKQKIKVASGGTPHGQRVFCEFNPSKVHVPTVRILLSKLLSPHAPAFVKAAKVGEIHLALDIDGACFKDCWVVDPFLRCSNATYEGDGTVMLGSKTGRTSLTIYDKKKQLWEVEGLLLANARLRIEWKFRRTGCTLSKLAFSKKPFARLLVLDRNLVASHVSVPVVGHFLACIESGKGAQAAYRLSANRKLLKAHLVECQAAWWKPEDVWALLPSALEVLKPLTSPAVKSTSKAPQWTAMPSLTHGASLAGIAG